MSRIQSLYTVAQKVWSTLRRVGKSVFKPEHMQEKRTYMFETEDGEQYNPFSDVTEGAEDDAEEEWKYTPSDF